MDWKFSPVDRLRDLIDGELDGSPYAVLYPEVAGATVEWIDRSDARIGTAGTPEDRAAANARTAFEKALHIGDHGGGADHDHGHPLRPRRRRRAARTC